MLRKRFCQAKPKECRLHHHLPSLTIIYRTKPLFNVEVMQKCRQLSIISYTSDRYFCLSLTYSRV